MEPPFPLSGTRRMAYNRREAAALYGVSFDIIARAIHSGALRAKKNGRRYLVSAEALEEWYESLPDA